MLRYVFPNEARAEVALEELQELIYEYGIASIADLHSLYYGSSSPDPNDSDFGWTDLSCAMVVHEDEEVILYLPDAHPLV